MSAIDRKTMTPLEAARALAPQIRDAADEIDERRELPRPLFEALADAGLFRMMIPRSLDGSEVDLPTYIKIIEEIGQADASTAWCINQGGVFATYAGRMPRPMAELLWIKTPRSVVANTPAPAGTAIVTEGGYRVSGRLPFSTGCRHASWLAANSRVFLENGQPRLLPDGEPESRLFFVPVAEAEILDTWQVQGMRGTGTNHFQVTDVFVPEERAYNALRAETVEPGPLYVVPRTLVFGCGDAAVALAVARTSLNALLELAGAKTPWTTPGLMRDQPLVQSQVGVAEANLRAGRAILTLTVREVWDSVVETGEITLDQRVALRQAITHATYLSVETVDAVYRAGGATSVFKGSLIQRCFQDIHVITQHVQMRLTNYESAGRFYLGLQPDMLRL